MRDHASKVLPTTTGITSSAAGHYSASATVKLKAHVDAGLSQAQLEELAGRLAHKRRELADRIEQMEQQITLKDDCSLADAAEAASLQESRIRARGIVDQDRQTIAEIDAALARLANGQYGVSAATGEPIVYERLLLVPWARTGAGELI